MQPALRDIFFYFLRLGATGFGGPVVLCSSMRRDLVVNRKWFTPAEYGEGLALAQLAPGPLAVQLAIYLGWVRFGIRGATVAGGGFVIPSFLLVLAISAAYLRFGGLDWIQSAFYAIGPAVVAIVARSAIDLIRGALSRDALPIFFCAGSAVVTAWAEAEIFWVFLVCGLVGAAWPAIRARRSAAGILSVLPLWWFAGLHGSADTATLTKLFLYFMKAGAFVFGSGLVIVPFLHAGVVSEFGWLTERQFLDAVAVAMITPGPALVTVGFIGYLTAGPVGATLAAVGVYLPCYLFVVVPAPYFRQLASNATIKAFIEGVTAAAIGAIAGAAVVLGRRAVLDWATAAIAAVVALALWRFRRVPDVAWILGAGVAGQLMLLL